MQNKKEDLRKNIKIAPIVHIELKVFCAAIGENIEDVAGMAIMKELKLRGHKFIYPQQKNKK